MQDDLYLHEEILLLALRDEEGTIAPGAMYQYAIGGAVLAELLLRKRVRLVGTGRSRLVDAVEATMVGDPLVDECLQKVVSAKRRASLSTWVSRFAGLVDLKHRVARRLCARGILRQDRERYLLVFSRRIYPEVNPEPEGRLVERLHAAIFGDDRDVPERTVVLVSLAYGAGLLEVAFGRQQLNARKARIEQLIAGEVTGNATREAVQAATMIAAILPALVVATSD